MKNQVSLSVHDFAITLVSCFDPEKLAPYLERVHALRASDVRPSPGVLRSPDGELTRWRSVPVPAGDGVVG
jgi:hypothetical protein